MPVLFLGIPFDFILFAVTLFGIALFHRHTLPIALGGLCIIAAYKLVFAEQTSMNLRMNVRFRG